MNYELTRSDLSLCRLISTKTPQILVEGDIIVPDTKPDIASILSLDIIPFMSDYICSDKTLCVKGSVAIKAIYSQPKNNDDEVANSQVCTMSSAFSFDNDLICHDLTKDSLVTVLPTVSRYEYIIANERKINVKVFLTFDIMGSATKAIDVISSIETDLPVQVLSKNIESYLPCACREATFTIKTDIRVPNSMPDINEILSMPVNISNRDIKVIGGKLMVCADLDIAVMYNNADCEISTLHHTETFREITEADGINEETHLMINMLVKDIYYEVLPNENGDMKNIHAEISINTYINAGTISNHKIINDCFLPGYDVDLCENIVPVSQVIGKNNNVLNVRHSCSLPDSMPKVKDIFHTEAVCKINHTDIKEDYIELDATINANVRYLSQNDSMPVSIFTFEIPVNEKINCDSYTKDTNALCQAFTDNISCLCSSGNTLEFKCSLICSTLAVKTNDIKSITGIDINEKESCVKAPSLTAYFASEGESIWDIAKKYNVIVDDIAKSNSLPSDTILKSGQQILIPRVSGKVNI